MLHGRIISAVVVTLFLAVSFAIAGETANIDHLENLFKQGGDLSKGYKDYKVPSTTPQTQNAVNAVSQHFYSPEYQKKVAAEADRLRNTVFKGVIEDFKKSGAKLQQGNVEDPIVVLPQDERIYIFISESVPKETLRNYVRDIDKIRDPRIVLVMRGLVGGMKYVKPTMEFISSLIKKNPACDLRKEKCPTYSAGVQIDPMIFTRYDIKHVPAFVHVDGLHLKDPAGSEGYERNIQGAVDASKLSGDVSLKYALERFKEERPNSASIKSLLKKLDKGFY